MNKEKYYMGLAELASQQSKDPHTKVGCAIIKNGRVLSLGWNGPPRDFRDSIVPWENRDVDVPLIEKKGVYIVHAEANSVLNYNGSLRDLEGASVYVTVSPCHECAKILAQLRVSEVVYKELYHRNDMVEVSDKIFRECGISCRKYDEVF